MSVWGPRSRTDLIFYSRGSLELDLHPLYATRTQATQFNPGFNQYTPYFWNGTAYVAKTVTSRPQPALIATGGMTPLAIDNLTDTVEWLQEAGSTANQWPARIGSQGVYVSVGGTYTHAVSWTGSNHPLEQCYGKTITGTPGYLFSTGNQIKRIDQTTLYASIAPPAGSLPATAANITVLTLGVGASAGSGIIQGDFLYFLETPGPRLSRLQISTGAYTQGQIIPGAGSTVDQLRYIQNADLPTVDGKGFIFSNSTSGFNPNVVKQYYLSTDSGLGVNPNTLGPALFNWPAPGGSIQGLQSMGLADHTNTASHWLINYFDQGSFSVPAVTVEFRETLPMVASWVTYFADLPKVVPGSPAIPLTFRLGDKAVFSRNADVELLFSPGYNDDPNVGFDDAIPLAVQDTDAVTGLATGNLATSYGADFTVHWVTDLQQGLDVPNLNGRVRLRVKAPVDNTPSLPVQLRVPVIDGEAPTISQRWNATFATPQRHSRTDIGYPNQVIVQDVLPLTGKTYRELSGGAPLQATLIGGVPSSPTVPHRPLGAYDGLNNMTFTAGAFPIKFFLALQLYQDTNFGTPTNVIEDQQILEYQLGINGFQHQYLTNANGVDVGNIMYVDGASLKGFLISKFGTFTLGGGAAFGPGMYFLSLVNSRLQSTFHVEHCTTLKTYTSPLGTGNYGYPPANPYTMVRVGRLVYFLEPISNSPTRFVMSQVNIDTGVYQAGGDTMPAANYVGLNHVNDGSPLGYFVLLVLKTTTSAQLVRYDLGATTFIELLKTPITFGATVPPYGLVAAVSATPPHPAYGSQFVANQYKLAAFSPYTLGSFTFSTDPPPGARPRNIFLEKLNPKIKITLVDAGGLVKKGRVRARDQIPFIVLKGMGFLELDDLQRPVIRTIAFRSPLVLQLYSAPKLNLVNEELINLTGTSFDKKGVYEILLLDKDKNIVCKFASAIEATTL